MSGLLSWLLLAIVPQEHVLVDRCDRIEINHVCHVVVEPHMQPRVEVVIDQLIFWQWSPSRRDWVVIDWRTVKQAGIPAAGVARWIDPDGAFREVRATCVVESWTSQDREVDNRQVIPHPQRRKLSAIHVHTEN